RCRPRAAAHPPPAGTRPPRPCTASRRPTGPPPSWYAGCPCPRRQSRVVGGLVMSFMVVAGGERREQLGPVGQRAGVDQALGAGRPLQRAEPALVVAPALSGRIGCLPVTDLADQRLAEVLPVDQSGLVERQRQPERPALPRRGEHQLAVVTRRCGRPGGVEEVGRVGVSSGTIHGAAASATPTMASRVTSAASSSSESPSVPAGRIGKTM